MEATLPAFRLPLAAACLLVQRTVPVDARKGGDFVFNVTIEKLTMSAGQLPHFSRHYFLQVILARHTISKLSHLIFYVKKGGTNSILGTRSCVSERFKAMTSRLIVTLRLPLEPTVSTESDIFIGRGV